MDIASVQLICLSESFLIHFIERVCGTVPPPAPGSVIPCGDLLVAETKAAFHRRYSNRKEGLLIAPRQFFSRGRFTQDLPLHRLMKSDQFGTARGFEEAGTRESNRIDVEISDAVLIQLIPVLVHKPCGSRNFTDLVPIPHAEDDISS